MVICVPYHLDERIDAFDPGVPVGQEIILELPPAGPWERMAALYEQVACAVAGQSAPPVVLSGDCTTSLGVLAGLQRAGRDVGIVWFDAHADFHTEASTTSGYLGGMPLALAVGVGTLTLPDALGLRPVPQDRAVLVDARDTDPGEHVLLERSSVRRTRLPDLDAADLPQGQLYLHVDIDVCDPAEIPDLLYPAPGGCALTELLASMRSIVSTGRVAAVGIAATWQHGGDAAEAHRDIARRLLRASSQ
jgi:arginase